MQKTKKNWALRIMVLALAFTLLSTCLLSNTLAKYITTANGSDTARVAKWGIEITSNLVIFDTEFATDNEDYDETITLSVLSGNSDNVFAPGTTKTINLASITGTPEVAFEVKFSVDPASGYTSTGTLSSNGLWTVDNGNEEYEPIKWTLSQNGTAVSGAEDVTFAELVTALEGFSAHYAPGVDASTLLSDIEIKWDWVFSVDDATDEKDTDLGNQAAAGIINSVLLDLEIQVVQID